jgi:mannose/fructose/N-acetylgalactosamine-specific phosphotransferase system component IID
MFLRKILTLICPLLTALCLAFGYSMIEPWIAFTAALITVLVWLFACKWSSTWLPSAALVVSVSLAAIGLLVGATPFLMLLGALLALTSWDLVFLDHVLSGNSPTKTVTLLERNHYQRLSLALGLTLLGTITGRIIHVQIPFGGMILLVMLAFFGFGRVWRMLSNSLGST